MEFDLPTGVSFGVPHQYAAFCNGTVVDVSTTNHPIKALKIGWDDAFLSFENDDKLVRYRRDRVVGLFMNPSEHIKGRTLATLRVVFVADDGQKGSLPVLTTDNANSSWLQSFAGQLANSVFPVTTEVLKD